MGRAEVKIRIDHLAKVFGGDDNAPTVAVQDFDLTVKGGEFVCIVGPSGCGKTTVMRIVAGLETPSSGSVTVAPGGNDRPQNAMVFQEQGLFPWMSVIDNAAFGLEMQGMGRRERHQRVAPFLDLIGLGSFHGHYPQQLSGGMRQRVSLARAFVAEPEILLMDEPFAALDAQNKLILQDELLRIWEGSHKTVLFITHAIDEAIALGDRIVVMTALPGRIKEIVPVDFPRPRSAVELRADPRFGALQLSIWRMLEAEVRAARLQVKA